RHGDIDGRWREPPPVFCEDQGKWRVALPPRLPIRLPRCLSRLDAVSPVKIELSFRLSTSLIGGARAAPTDWSGARLPLCRKSSPYAVSLAPPARPSLLHPVARRLTAQGISGRDPRCA